MFGIVYLTGQSCLAGLPGRRARNSSDPLKHGRAPPVRRLARLLPALMCVMVFDRLIPYGNGKGHQPSATNLHESSQEQVR